MRTRVAIVLFVALTAAAPVAGQAIDPAPYARVLSEHAVAGGVDYAGLARDRTDLDAYVRSLAGVSAAQFDAWPRAEQVAYLINAYNALVILQVVDEYPIKRSLRPSALVRPGNSVWQIDGFFDGIEHRVAGRDMTLDGIEHEWLRKRYAEPRIHAALVCAAHSCPPLRAEPFAAARLGDQLDDQMRLFVNDRERNRFDRADGKVRLSSIFDWFAEDFTSFAPDRGYAAAPDKARGVLALIARYLPDDTAVWLRDGRYEVDYLDYDWTLNEP